MGVNIDNKIKYVEKQLAEADAQLVRLNNFIKEKDHKLEKLLQEKFYDDDFIIFNGGE